MNVCSVAYLIYTFLIILFKKRRYVPTHARHAPTRTLWGWGPKTPLWNSF